MKLGTQTSSLQNHLFSRMVVGQPTPEVGMGATLLCWTDRHAATIAEVFTINGRLFVGVQQDKATRTDRNGFSEDQAWTFERDPEAAVQHFRMRQNGMWEPVAKNTATGRWKKLDSSGLRIGQRDEYYDPHF